MPNGLAPKLPLSYDHDDGFLLIKDYKDLIQQNLKNLILTRPGERVMDSNFGVGLDLVLFEMNEGSVIDELEGKIQQQVQRYMPFIQLTDFEILPNPDTYSIAIKMSYYISPLGSSDSLFIRKDVSTSSDLHRFK